MSFNDFVKLLSKIKNIPLLGETSHFKMVPPTRKAYAKYSELQIRQAKKAGVLALFYPNDSGETYFVLILRKTYKGVHSAQISFPGGKLEPNDKDLQETAVRETYEEVGVPINSVKVVKQLSKVYIPPSNFCVQPYMGIVNAKPVFIKQDDEVEQLIEVRLSHLLKDDYLTTKKVTTSYSLDIKVPAFKLNHYVVWGATAMVLSEIKDMIKQLT